MSVMLAQALRRVFVVVVFRRVLWPGLDGRPAREFACGRALSLGFLSALGPRRPPGRGSASRPITMCACIGRSWWRGGRSCSGGLIAGAGRAVGLGGDGRRERVRGEPVVDWASVKILNLRAAGGRVSRAEWPGAELVATWFDGAPAGLGRVGRPLWARDVTGAGRVILAGVGTATRPPTSAGTTRKRRPRRGEASRFLPRQRATFAGREPLEADRADRDPAKRHDLVTELGQHPADLAFLAFGQDQLEHGGLALAAHDPCPLARTLPSDSQTPSVSLASISRIRAVRRPARDRVFRRRSEDAPAGWPDRRRWSRS